MNTRRWKTGVRDRDTGLPLFLFPCPNGLLHRDVNPRDINSHGNGGYIATKIVDASNGDSVSQQLYRCIQIPFSRTL